MKPRKFDFVGFFCGHGMQFRAIGTIGTNAVSIIMHTHWDIYKQLSIFTIEDIYQIWGSLNNTSIMFPDTFTAYLITAHGTYYAIKISNPQALINFGNTWFNDWDVDLSVLPSGTTYLSHSEKIKDEFYSKIKNRKIADNEKNEKNFAKFISQYNLGISLYKSSDATFTNWSKVNSDGSSTPCN